MVKLVELKTPRLTLRQWRPADLPVFAQLNADPQVMEFFPSPLNETQSNELARLIRSLIESRGWGFWAVNENDTEAFIGFVGLHEPAPELPCSPCVEVGWRLAKNYWGKGYATEAARAALNFAFTQLDLQEVYSFTAVSNQRSRAVMERLGMWNTQNNFNHPKVPEGNPLREHVLFKVTKQRWLGAL